MVGEEQSTQKRSSTALDAAGIERNIRHYLTWRDDGPTLDRLERYASFDYCFNYFQSMRERPEELLSAANLQHSCLQLGFYLASWGMLRGSSFLLQRSVRAYVPVLEAIVQADRRLWEIDVHCYNTGDHIDLLLDFYRELAAALKPPKDLTDTLATKIMLGVFGCVPAFDTYFKTNFGVSYLGKSALKRVAQCYEDNCELIERYRIPTIDFDTGRPTQHCYTRAKVIDMAFFITGP